MGALAGRFRELLGPGNVFEGAAVEPRYLIDAGSSEPGEARCVVRPASTAELSAVMAACHAAGQPVIVQGGRTGLVHGARPRSSEVVVSLERLNAIEEIDAAAATITVQAGVPLERVQEAAERAGFSFPLDIGARGSCTLGGMIATNAGGNRVIRYGMTRDMVLGLEVVLADGTVITSLNKMIKNNAGYDLKQLFIGSEGTLGIVTRAVLRLRPEASGQVAALCALRSFEQVVTLLRRLERGLGGQLSAFEVMWNDYYRAAHGLPRAAAAPLALDHELYVLVECTAGDSATGEAMLATALSQASEAGLVADAVVARSGAESRRLWAIRDAVAELMPQMRHMEPYDVSVPIGRMGELVLELKREFTRHWPTARQFYFGHLGDSNLHLVVDMPTRAAIADADRLVYGMVRNYSGSISAEHGIGILKRDYLGHSRSPAEIELMMLLKRTLDPRAILAPGRVIGPPSG